MKNLSIKMAGIMFKTPVINASGTLDLEAFTESKDIFDSLLQSLGAYVTKTLTFEPRKGNPPPRIWEVFGGIINWFRKSRREKIYEGKTALSLPNT